MKLAIYLSIAAILCTESADGQNEYLEGRQLFRTYCSACHDVHSEIYGPQLASITKKRTTEWLHSFIRDSQGTIISGDAYAQYLFKRYDRAVMPSFEFLSQAHINEIISYISYESEQKPNKKNNGEASSDILRGKQIFQDQCETCHAIDFEKDAPALGSVSKRLPYPWLRNFIHDSQEVIQAGDRYANHLYDQFDHKVMVPMEFLSDDEITDILDYIQYTCSSSPVAIPQEQQTGFIEQSAGLSPKEENSYSFLLFAAAGFLVLTMLLILVIRLFRALGTGN